MTNNPSLGAHPQPTTPVYRQMNAAAARDVHRHSQFVGILRWILPFFCLLVIGLFLFSSGILNDLFISKPKEAPPVIAENTVEMVQPKMSGLDKKKRAYQITAKSAKQRVDDPTKVTLEYVKGSLVLNENDDKVTLTARTGYLDTESNFLQLRQDIIITSEKGYTAYLNSVDAKLKEKYITSKDPVVIKWEGGSIHANGLEITDNGNVIRFLNRVKVTLQPKSAKGKMK